MTQKVTTAEKVTIWVARAVDRLGQPVTLTEIFLVTAPRDVIALGYDEIAFIYADGSRYATGLTSDAEYIEFEALRERIAR